MGIENADIAAPTAVDTPAPTPSDPGAPGFWHGKFLAIGNLGVINP